MNRSWDSYWEKGTGQQYWLNPDDSVIELARNLDKSRIRAVLDLGCGIGRHSLYLAEQGYRIIAVDSSSSALAVLREQAGRRSIRIEIIEGDYLQDLFPSESFDMVLSYNVIYHGTRDTFRDALHLVHKWLRPGGLFFFTCPTRRDGKYGNGEQVAPNAYKPLNSIHPGDIHYFADDADISDLLDKFTTISKKVYEHYWDNSGAEQFSSYWRILATK